MTQTLKTALILSIALALVLSAAGPGQSAVEIQKFQMADNLYRLQCPGAKDFTVSLMVLKGENGLLVIDAGYFNTQEEVAELIGSIGNGKVTTLVYTHYHGDHLGSSKLIGGEATIIAHENTARRLDMQYGFMGEESVVALPTSTLGDSLIIDFEGQKVRLLHFPRAHTDGDVVVHFVDANVVFLGDLVFGGMLPFIHGSRGGTVTGLRKCFEAMLEMFPDDVTFVPAHGQPHTKAQLVHYDEQLMKMVGIVEAEIEGGKSADEIIAADALGEWRAWSKPDYNTDTVLIASIYENKIYAGNPPKPISEVLLPMVMEKGVEAALDFYREVKSTQPDKYDFGEGELNALGYNLMWRKMLDEAEVVFKLNIEAFPESGNAYDSMGELYVTKGDKAAAIKNYEKSLELAPDNANAVEVLKTLKETP